MLELINVSKKFGNRKIIDEVNLKINSKDIIGVLGANGAGKSVLLKTISGFLKPDNGKIISYDDIGISIQDNSLYESLSVYQNLSYFADIYKVKDKKTTIQNISNRLGISSILNSNVGNLSGGTKKKVDIACSLINGPRVLILDEPFTGLDKNFVNELINLLKEINSYGVSLIISTHIFPQIKDICNRFILVKDSVVSEISKYQATEMF